MNQAETQSRHSFTHIDDSHTYLASLGLVRYRNKPDRSLHELRTAMHHNSSNQERALNLSILKMSGPDKFPRVESNYLDTIPSLQGISSLQIAGPLCRPLGLLNLYQVRAPVKDTLSSGSSTYLKITR